MRIDEGMSKVVDIDGTWMWIETVVVHALGGKRDK